MCGVASAPQSLLNEGPSPLRGAGGCSSAAHVAPHHQYYRVLRSQVIVKDSVGPHPNPGRIVPGSNFNASNTDGHPSGRYQREVDQALRAKDLTHLQFISLMLIAWMGRDGGSVSQAELARFGDIHPMQVSNVLKALDQKRMIVRAREAGSGPQNPLSSPNAGLSVFAQRCLSSSRCSTGSLATTGLAAVSSRLCCDWRNSPTLMSRRRRLAETGPQAAAVKLDAAKLGLKSSTIPLRPAAAVEKNAAGAAVRGL